MAEKCTNCGQTILATDAICWHCGHQLRQQTTLKLPPKVTIEKEADDEEPLSLTAVFVYGAMTLVVIVAILLVMNALGQKPLIILNPETFLQNGWRPFTDQNQTFTLDLPPKWQLLEKQAPQQQTGFDQLISSDSQYQAAVLALGDATADMELQVVATGEAIPDTTAIPVFLLVGRSARLQQVTPSQIVTFVVLNNGDLEISEANLFESIFGEDRPNFVIELPNTKDQLKCHQQLVDSAEYTFLVAGCAPKQFYGRYTDDIDDMLTSFQGLSRP